MSERVCLCRCVICMKQQQMKAYHEHKKAYDLINKKCSFNRKSLVALWAKLPTWLRQVEIWQNQNNFVGMIK
jgi:hypothetical protein